jgi:hypothetical protein
MNVPRRIAALRREVDYRKAELERIARLQAAGGENLNNPLLAGFIEKYLADIRLGIAQRQAEIRILQAGS